MKQLSKSSLPFEQPWTLDQYQLVDFLSNETLLCSIRSQWVHFEEYLLTTIGLLITLFLTIRIHFAELRFKDYFALVRSHILSGCLIGYFLLSFLFNLFPNEKHCRWEQILIQFISTILMINLFLIGLFRRFTVYFNKRSSSLKWRWILFSFLIGLICQLIVTSIWYSRSKKKTKLHYYHQACFHNLQIDFCFHAVQPLYLPTLLVPIVFLLTTINVYRFTRPFAIAELLESIMSCIGLIMSGSMWLMNLFFSNYPQMPYRYVAYVILLTYLVPRIWISELERSRITVEEVKPLLHDQVQFHNDNCTIRFPQDDDNDEDDEEEDDRSDRYTCGSVSFQVRNDSQRSKRMIRTMDMSPGEIFTSILEQHDKRPPGQL